MSAQPDESVREGLVVLGRHRVFVREIGSGDPVLLINGIGAHTRMWGLMERTLVGRRVISFDAPGAGRSPTPRVPVSVRQLSMLAMAVLDHAGVRKADAVGYSMGGIVLQQLLADCPSRVNRAVLVSTSPGIGGLYGPATSLLNVSTPLRFLSDRMYLRSVGDLVGGRARTDRQWVVEHLPIRMQERPSVLGYSQQVASLSTWSGLPLLGTIPNPVLVLTGDDDPLTPVGNGALMAHLIPNARLRVVQGEGHLMPLDESSPTPGMIRDFLAAPDLGQESAWQGGVKVSAADVRQALGRRSAQLQPLPLGLLGAAKRRRWLPRQR